MDNGAINYRRYLDGDESAFDEIIRELFDSLVFFIDRYVNDHHTAEDIAIDAFSDLVVHKGRYNFKVSLKTYLFMIGRSRALNYIKRRNLIRMEPLSEAESLAQWQSMEERILSDVRKRAVHNAIRQLPEDMGAAVHMKYFEGLGYAQIARVMKKSTKQVDNLLYRAKKELRAILGEEGESLV